MNHKEIPWTEKYRPHKLEDITIGNTSFDRIGKL